MMSNDYENKTPGCCEYRPHIEPTMLVQERESERERKAIAMCRNTVFEIVIVEEHTM